MTSLSSLLYFLLNQYLFIFKLGPRSSTILRANEYDINTDEVLCFIVPLLPGGEQSFSSLFYFLLNQYQFIFKFGPKSQIILRVNEYDINTDEVLYL